VTNRLSPRHALPASGSTTGEAFTLSPTGESPGYLLGNACKQTRHHAAPSDLSEISQRCSTLTKRRPGGKAVYVPSRLSNALHDMHTHKKCNPYSVAADDASDGGPTPCMIQCSNCSTAGAAAQPICCRSALYTPSPCSALLLVHKHAHCCRHIHAQTSRNIQARMQHTMNHTATRLSDQSRCG
jgi:hypothetical protein